MPRTYVNNAYNRRVGRVGLPVGSAVISKNTIGGFNTRTYVDNAKNRSLGRVGLPHGSAVESKYCSGLTSWNYLDERLPRTYKQENIYDHSGTGDTYQQDDTWKTSEDASHRELFSSLSQQARNSSDESSSLVGHKPDIYNRQASAESRHTKSSGEGSIENLTGKQERQRKDYTVPLAQKNSLEDQCEKLKEESTREKTVSKADKEQSVVSLREQNTTLRGKLERQREENAVLLGQKNSLHDLCEKLKEELTRMKIVAKEDKEQAVVSLRELNTTLQRKLKTFSDEKVSLLEQKSILEETCQKLREEITCLNHIAKEQRKQTNSAVNQLRADFQTQVDDQQERIRSLEASLGSLQNNHQVAIATIQKLQGDLQNRADTIETLHREKSHYMQQCKAMNDQLRNLNVRVKEKEGNIISLWQQIAAIQKKYVDMMRSVRSLESLPDSPLYNALVVLQKFYYRQFGTKPSITPENVQHLHTLVEAARSELRTISDIEGKVAEAIVAHINMTEENSRLHGLVGEQVIETRRLKNQIQLLKGKVLSLERILRRNPRTEE